MALKTFVSGEVLTASDTNVYLVNNLYAVKTANEGVTSSTTLQDDNHLTVAVAANSTYQVDMMLMYDGGTTGDLKIGFTFPASSSLHLGCIVTHGAAATAGGEATTLHIEDSATLQLGAIGVGSTLSAIFLGRLGVAGTAGSFTLQWAQFASSVTSTTLMTGCFLVLRRIS